jgi:hypothetical protein
VPALAIEMLRVAIGAPSVRLHVSGSKVQAVSTGDFIVPIEADGPSASTIRGAAPPASYRPSTSSTARWTRRASRRSSC